jgi:Spondin_N.
MSDDTTRRRVLLTTGSIATAGLAGCSAGGGSDATATDTATDAPTPTETATATETPTATATPAATTFEVRIENVGAGDTLSTPDGAVPVPLSPGAYAAHTDEIQLFAPGEEASTGIERIAEDGMPGPLLDAVGGADAVLDGGAFNTPEGADGPGPLTPGNAYSFEVTAAADDDPLLSLATMFIQSNDLFYAFDAAGLPLFEDGEPVTGDLTAELRLWDAGTEVNERPGVGPNQAPRQSGTDTGMSEGVVREVNDGYDYPAVEDVIDVRVSPR